ncbi:MAG: NUDIX hydrolase [Oscillospiraceae bacterium]
MTNKHTIVAVKGLIVHNNKILLMQRSNSDPINPGIWEFAGGSVEFGETLDNALIREVQEETGLTIQIKKLLYADASLIREDRYAVVLCYHCITSQNEVALSFEHKNYLWASKEEALQMLYPPIANNLIKYNVFNLVFQ